MKEILSILFMSIILTAIILFFLHVLRMTNVGDWIELIVDNWLFCK